MSSEAAVGAVKGAAQGAAVGSVVPVVGTVIGAVVGGVIGLVSGMFSSKAKGKKKKANEIRAKMAERDAAIQRRDLVRNIRIQRAQSVSAGTGDGEVISSAVAGATGSIGAQGSTSLDFFDTQYFQNTTANKYNAKAEQYAGYSAAGNTLLNSMGGIASAGMSMAGMFRQGAKPVQITGAAAQPSYQYPTGAGASRMPTVGYGNTMQKYGLK